MATTSATTSTYQQAPTNTSNSVIHPDQSSAFSSANSSNPMHHTSKLDKSTATSPSSTTDTTLDINESMVNSDKIDLTEPDAKRRRQKHTAEFKTEVREKLAEGKTPKEVISIYHSLKINKSQIIKWKMAKDKIIAAAADRKIKKLTRIRPATKHKELYRELLKVFRETRSKGRHVDFNRIYSNARKIMRELTGHLNAIVKQHVIANFIKWYNLKRRKIQRNKQLPKEHYRNRIEKWHSTLHERGIRTGASDPNNHKKWGSFRLNVDQSPQPFARETTMAQEEIQLRDEENRDKRIWTAQTDTGDSKRFCTLQICFRSTGEQPRIAIILRGQFLRISAVEKKAWCPDVDVYFQKNAWADTVFYLE